MSDLKPRILRQLDGYSPELRKRRATTQDLAQFETEFGALPDDVRWFLQEAGGGVVGREHLDGIEDLTASQRKYFGESGRDG